MAFLLGACVPASAQAPCGAGRPPPPAAAVLAVQGIGRTIGLGAPLIAADLLNPLRLPG
ncbi:hypothetical protein ACFVH6_41230 [Spirillospora sp. NPDC127200]